MIYRFIKKICELIIMLMVIPNCENSDAYFVFCPATRYINLISGRRAATWCLIICICLAFQFSFRSVLPPQQRIAAGMLDDIVTQRRAVQENKKTSIRGWPADCEERVQTRHIRNGQTGRWRSCPRCPLQLCRLFFTMRRRSSWGQLHNLNLSLWVKAYLYHSKQCQSFTRD